jgi:predicted nucleic acid-binding protein
LLKLYLDTSAIVKRYVAEPGTETVDAIFDKAETGELTIARVLKSPRVKNLARKFYYLKK